MAGPYSAPEPLDRDVLRARLAEVGIPPGYITVVIDEVPDLLRWGAIERKCRLIAQVVEDRPDGQPAGDVGDVEALSYSELKALAESPAAAELLEWARRQVQARHLQFTSLDALERYLKGEDVEPHEFLGPFNVLRLGGDDDQ